ncbi:hypothetical protein [Hydrogenophaga sp.]|uniref:hypothetical protein n=1 Tax=Hydrogenophaga sp. TaxID=1904254 RepID=UPI002FC854A4
MSIVRIKNGASYYYRFNHANKTYTGSCRTNDLEKATLFEAEVKRRVVRDLHDHKPYDSEWLPPDALTKERHRMFMSAMSRAQAAGREFNITEEDIKLPVLCPVFGMMLKYTRGKRVDSSASLDRIDCTKGYTADNVWVISWRANHLKNNGTSAEFERLASHLRRFGL